MVVVVVVVQAVTATDLSPTTLGAEGSCACSVVGQYEGADAIWIALIVSVGGLFRRRGSKSFRQA